MSERRSKFKVGQVVMTKGTVILKFVPKYWRIHKIVRYVGGKFKYAGFEPGPDGPYVAETQLRALTKRERADSSHKASDGGERKTTI